MSLKADAPELTIKEIKKKLKIESISVDDLKKIINQVVKDNMNLIKEKEIRAKGPLMGEVMKKARGKIDGAVVSKELEIAIKEELKEMK